VLVSCCRQRCAKASCDCTYRPALGSNLVQTSTNSFSLSWSIFWESSKVISLKFSRITAAWPAGTDQVQVFEKERVAQDPKGVKKKASVVHPLCIYASLVHPFCICASLMHPMCLLCQAQRHKRHIFLRVCQAQRHKRHMSLRVCQAQRHKRHI
jgi:hypothetical protein